MSEAVSEESPSQARFTLRKLLAVVWVVGAFLGAYRFGGSGDLYPLFFMGIPTAVLGYRLITWQRCGWLLTTSLLLFFAYGSFTSWVWPRVICPIDLPASATNLKVRDKLFLWIGADTQVKFHAPVKDCRAVLTQLEDRYHGEFGLPIAIEASDYRLNPAAAPWSFYPGRAGVPSWFNPNKIQEGEYYQGPVSVWIDTKRGIFYLYNNH